MLFVGGGQSWTNLSRWYNSSTNLCYQVYELNNLRMKTCYTHENTIDVNYRCEISTHLTRFFIGGGQSWTNVLNKMKSIAKTETLDLGYICYFFTQLRKFVQI